MSIIVDFYIIVYFLIFFNCVYAQVKSLSIFKYEEQSIVVIPGKKGFVQLIEMQVLKFSC